MGSCPDSYKYSHNKQLLQQTFTENETHSFFFFLHTVCFTTHRENVNELKSEDKTKTKIIWKDKNKNKVKTSGSTRKL